LSAPSAAAAAASPLLRLTSAARIGTCSARRTAQIRALRPDLEIRPLRGNVPTRLGRLASGDLDAIVLARAGLVRLGLDAHISEIFPVSVLLPAPAQGALAVQCRAADADLAALLSRLDDEDTRRAVDAERMVLHALGGGCSVPVGAAATVVHGEVWLTAGVFALDTPHRVEVEVRGSRALEVGREAARRLLDLGAGEILASFGKDALGARS
jgi:hydroxymethylbilane synthase